MKLELSSIDLRILSQEFQTLKGGFIDKIFQEKDLLRLRVRLPGGGRQELSCKVGKWVYLNPAGGTTQRLDPFGQQLRRMLGNPRIEAVRQHGLDRILLFEFRKEKPLQLVFELYAKGNVLLLSEGKVLLSYRKEAGREKTPLEGTEYHLPVGVDPLTLTSAEITERLSTAKADLVRTLAVQWGLGGTYAEEVVARAELEKNRPAPSLSREEGQKLWEALRGLQSGIAAPAPRYLLEGGRVTGYAALALRKHEGKEFAAASSLSEAIQTFIEEGRPTTPGELAREKLLRRLQKQQEEEKLLGEEERLTGEQAESIYANFQRVEKTLRDLREEGKAKDAAIVDRAKRLASLKLSEGGEVVLDYRLDATKNAQRLYEKRREAQGKLSRVRLAILRTQSELSTADEPKKPAQVPSAKPTRKFWFDAYRWFLTSEGHLVVGGRDAKSNEKLVRRYLESGDRYVHAEVQGAPSLVVKGGARAGEATLKEACQFALLHSKAWKLKLAAGSAYWVLPEQVSKTGESGEYVARGGFMIRGKRNFYKDLRLEAAVGLVKYEGGPKVMCGPKTAVQAHAEAYVVFEVGEKDPKRLGQALALRIPVPSEEIFRVLPPGGLHITDTIGMPEIIL